MPGHHVLRLALFASVLTSAAIAQCQVTWQPMVELPGTNKRVKDVVTTPGGDLYACGWFSVAGNALVNRIARWDGSQWHALGLGLEGPSPEAMVVMPNGDLIVGGGFTTAGGQNIPHIARWDGSTWSAVGNGLDGRVNALHLLPNGDLLAGGTFFNSGATPMKRLARWDGTTWHAFGGGADNATVWAIESLPNGDVAVGGTFTSIGGVAAHGVGIWDGSAWTVPAVGVGSEVYALEALPGGELAIGGMQSNSIFSLFATYAGGVVTQSSCPVSPEIWVLYAEPNGDLVAGGGTSLGTAGTVARLSGGQWTLLDSGWSKTFALLEYGGELLAAGGPVGNLAELTIRTHDGTDWSAFGAPGNAYRVDRIVADGDQGVYVAGFFESMVGVPANNVAHWDGGSWSALGSGVDGIVNALATAPNGDLIVAGDFTTAGGAPAQHIARWNGSNWSTLGGGLPAVPTDIAVAPSGAIVAITGYADVLVYNGASWSQLPAIQSQYLISLRSIVVLPDNTVVVAGAGDAAAWRLDLNWVPMEPGFFNTKALAVGAGGEIYRIGNSGYGVYQWNGSTWSILGSSITGNFYDLVPLPNGDLVALGTTGFFGGVARWDGNTWQTIDGGIGENTGNFALGSTGAFTSDGKLVVGGSFASIGSVASLNLAYATTDCMAAATTFGTGCAGTAGPVSLHADSLPWLGSTHRAHAEGLPAQSLAVLVFGSTPTVQALPQGAPGCAMFVVPVIADLRVPWNGSVDASLDVPNDPALLAAQFRTQVVGIELGPGLSITLLTASNALELTIGAF